MCLCPRCLGKTTRCLGKTARCLGKTMRCLVKTAWCLGRTARCLGKTTRGLGKKQKQTKVVKHNTRQWQRLIMILGRSALSTWLGCLGQVDGRGGRWGEWMRECRAGIPPKGILLIKEVKTASHSTHGDSTLARHCCGGENNGVGRDPVAPMVWW